MLEPYEGKLSRTVLRGEGGSNALDLPDIQKQGDFFVESPIILLAAIIWYLRIYKDGKYCTFPHAIEFLNKPYADIFTILTSYPSLENYLSPFMDAWQGGAQDQLQVPDSKCENPSFANDLATALLGDDGRRFHAGFEQSRTPQNPLRGQ